ncbi:MAG: PstS family phosphate ABC transporter substrate-binding protein [Thermomicrobiales bacterium]
MDLIRSRMSRRTFAGVAAGATAIMVAGSPAIFSTAAAQDATPIPYEAPDNIGDLSGEFEADGSSTLGPLTEAAIEEFATIAPNVRITNGISGTGGGFERFTKGEIAIANASRSIKPEEAEAAAAAGIPWYKFDVAYDGITVVVSAENDFVESLTVEQLAKIWSADGGVTNWSDVDSSWPAEPIELYGPGTASGTFDYFNEEILGEDTDVRTDYTPSEDDNVLVQGVAGSKYALGYFGFSYYEENQDTLKALAIDGGNGPVAPSIESISDGTYTPLGRTLFIYVNANDLKSRQDVAEFVRFYLATADEIAPSVGYIPLPGADELAQQAKFNGAMDGSVAPDSDAAATPAAATPAA